MMNRNCVAPAITAALVPIPVLDLRQVLYSGKELSCISAVSAFG